VAKCTICDAVLPADALYCAKCGAKVNRAGDIGPPPGAKPFVGNNLSGDSNAGGHNPGDGDASVPPERVRTHQAGGPRRTDSPEEEVWTGTYSPKAMATAIVGGGLLTIAILVGWIIFRESITWWWMPLIGIVLIWVLIGGQLLYRMYSVRYRLTNQRFFHEKGILRRVVDRIEVIDLDDITYIQNILDRMLNIGTIKITSSDRTHPELVLRGIDNVKDVAAKIDAARRAERIRRGLHIEAI
jgi:membrane protein YdbS with pleckstrin-like domain